VATLVRRAPDATLYTIDVSFAALQDETERNYLNPLPTSFVLDSEAVDRLRAAAQTIILDSPEFQRLLEDIGATVVGTERPLPAAPRSERPAD
jgi:NTE family protein